MLSTSGWKKKQLYFSEGAMCQKDSTSLTFLYQKLSPDK